MIKRMLTSAVFAGFAVGLLAAALHFAFVQKYILLSELYETGAVTHFASGSSADDAVAAPLPEPVPEPAPVADPSAGQAVVADGAGDPAEAAASHGGDHGTPAIDLVRNGYTVLFAVLVYSAYALLMIAGFGLAEAAGRKIGPTEGLLWGLAGFASFQMAPALGLAPGLPGTIAAEIAVRQTWWWGAVAATSSAIALISFGRKPWAYVPAAALLAAPHVIGAPQIDAYYGVVPPEVAAAFSASVLGVGLMVWLSLGWVAGSLWQRSAT